MDRANRAIANTKIQDNKRNIQILLTKTEIKTETEGRTNSTEHANPDELDDEDVKPEEEEGNPTVEDDRPHKSWQKMKMFCVNWGLDCQMVLIIGLMMTAIWVLCTVIIIAIVVQTIRLTLRLERINHYLDLKSTNIKQEDHDAEMLERKEKGRDDPHPNPSRNHKEIDHLKSKVIEMNEDARQRRANITRLNQHVALLEAKEGIPLLPRIARPY